MIVCDICHDGFHMKCLRPKLEFKPVGEWNCPACSAEINGDDKSKSGRGARNRGAAEVST